MEQTTKNLLKFLILPLLILAVVVWVADRQTRPDFLLHVDFLDVGQGDSVFVQTYLGNQIVIDGGPSDKVLAELGREMPFFDRTIDMLILTHPDADHVSGFVDVLKRYRVKKVLVTGVAADTAVYQEFKKYLDREKAEIIYAQMGQRIWLDSGTVFDVYWPQAQEHDRVLKKTNDTSIMGKLTFGHTAFFFTGDAEAGAEEQITEMFDVDSDVLKVGHHGSKTSSTLKFLEEVTPQYAVIEVGENNKYGHPTQEVLDNLSSVHAKILRTDLDHTVRFTSDGASLVRK